MDNDIIDISMDFGSLDNFSSNKNNFGSGIELLMNDRKTGPSNTTSDINIDDLNNLENELNDLAQETTSGSLPNTFDSGLFGVKSNFDDKPSVHFDETPEINFVEPPSYSSNLGNSTLNTNSDTKTWDGYGKFNNIPINPDIKMSSSPKISREELLKEKFKYLRKLEALEKKGVELTKKYNMESNLEEMQGEYEMIMEEKSKQNSVKFQGNMMMAIINGIEFLNNRFDPFDIKLDGWGEQINENITDYDEIFGELYEKYKSKASLAPELKLLFQLGGSAMMVHMSNTMFKSAMPGMDDILRQNPDLMKQFQTAAVNSMASSNPGFSGFMSGIMNPTPTNNNNNNNMYREPSVPRGNGPPPPMATQGPNIVPPSRPGNNFNSRSDISLARGAVFDDGISIKESNLGVPGYEPPQPSQKSSRRPDMKGPSDLTDILSGLKTKTITVEKATTPLNQTRTHDFSPSLSTINLQQEANNNSIISIDDLKSIQSEANVPKRSRRKQKSDKNTVSLDI
jgi:hypothetical protein